LFANHLPAGKHFLFFYVLHAGGICQATLQCGGHGAHSDPRFATPIPDSGFKPATLGDLLCSPLFRIPPWDAESFGQMAFMQTNQQAP